MKVQAKKAVAQNEGVLKGRGLGVVTPLFSLLFLLIVLPVGILLYGAFSKSPPGEINFAKSNFTLSTVKRVLGSSTLQKSTLVTLQVVVIGVIFAVVVATALAWLVARTDIPFRRLIGAGVLAPLVISPLVSGIAWSSLGASRSGLINMVFRSIGLHFSLNIGTIFGLAFVMGTIYMPYAYLLIIGALRGIDSSVEEAAAICGANDRQTLSRITFTLIRPAIFASFLLVGVTLMGMYVIPFMLGEPAGILLLTSYIGRFILTAPPDLAAADVIGLCLVIVTAISVVVQNRILNKRQYTTVSGKGYRRQRIKLGRFRFIAGGLAIFYMFVTVVLPFLAILQVVFAKSQYYTNLKTILNPHNFSLNNLFIVFRSPGIVRSMTNSLLVGSMAAFFGVILSFMVSYIRRRTEFRGRGLIETISIMPVAIPSLILGLGFLWAWISLPIGFYGTIYILVAAFVAHQMPLGVRSIDGTLMQLHVELEEAARICGASRLKTIVRIVLPLTRRGTFACAMLFFVISIREIGPILFLYNSHTMVMSGQVLESWAQGSIATAATVAFVSAIIVAILLGVSKKLFEEEND
jgi:iron(III) transport system permease protein